MAQRTVKFYKQHFQEFYTTLAPPVKKKVTQVLVWIATIDRLPVSILKSIASVKGLYELRIECGGNIFRIFCCFDKGDLVILFNGFQKKTQKTPQGEIEKAKKLMNQYFNENNYGTDKG